MIRRDVVELSIRIKEENPRVKVSAPFGSPVRDLAVLSRHPWAERLNTPERVEPLANEIITATTTQLPGMSMTHDVRETEVVKMFSQTLFKRLSVLRDEIIPLVETVASRVNQNVVEEIPETWAIETLPFQELYRSKLFAEFLSPYPATLIRDASSLSGLSDRTEEEIAGLLNTGSTSLNELVVEIIAKYPSNWLKEVYEKYFKAGAPSKINTRFNPFLSWAILDELIVVHILSRVIQAKGVIDSTIAMPLNDFQAALGELIVATGSTINRCLVQLIDFANAKLLAVNVDRTTSTVYVLEDNYNAFIQDGGTPDALIGAVIARATSEPYPEIVDHKAEYETIARKDFEERTLAIANNVVPRIASVMPAIIKEQFDNLRSETLALFISPGDYRGLVKGQRITPETIGDLGVILGALVPEAKQGNDIRRICKFLIVDLCLAHLEFGKLLDKIDKSVEIAKQSGQVLGVRQACYFAVIDELVEQISQTSTEVSAVVENKTVAPSRFVYQR